MMWFNKKSQGEKKRKYDGTYIVRDPAKQNGFFMKKLYGRFRVLAMKAENQELKIEMNKLLEEIRYSEPDVEGRMENVDTRIVGVTDMLEESLDEHETGKAAVHVDQLKRLIAERNARLREGNW